MINKLEVKPICSIHKKSIEKINKGKAIWVCSERKCNGGYIGLNNKIISDIWMSYWDDQDSLPKFKASLGSKDYLFETPLDILIDSISREKNIDKIESLIKEKRNELIIEEEEDIKKRKNNLNKANERSNNIKKLLSKKPCLSCGMVPDISGSCSC